MKKIYIYLKTRAKKQELFEWNDAANAKWQNALIHQMQIRHLPQIKLQIIKTKEWENNKNSTSVPQTHKHQHTIRRRSSHHVGGCLFFLQPTWSYITSGATLVPVRCIQKQLIFIIAHRNHGHVVVFHCTWRMVPGVCGRQWSQDIWDSRCLSRGFQSVRIWCYTSSVCPVCTHSHQDT